MRPESLAEVAQLAESGNSFDRCLAEFLDQFYSHPNAGGIEDRPALLAPQFGNLGRVEDAYLAATAEELARQYDLPLPAWVHEDVRKLRLPWFASALAGLRAVLILESPPGFRSRNLFVSANALSRA